MKSKFLSLFAIASVLLSLFAVTPAFAGDDNDSPGPAADVGKNSR